MSDCYTYVNHTVWLVNHALSLRSNYLNSSLRFFRIATAWLATAEISCDVLLGYNRAHAYALGVALLSDRAAVRH